MVANQQQIFLRLAAQLQPHWRTDTSLPARIQRLLAAHRNFGSRDRRLYRELLYTTIRFLPWVESLLQTEPQQAAAVIAWLAADLPATHAYRSALPDPWPPCPESIAAKAAWLNCETTALLPPWLQQQCPAAFRSLEMDALHRRASLWVRVQTADKAAVTREFETRGWAWRNSSILSDAIEVLSEADLSQSEAYSTGRFEIQDLGSQLILESVGVQSGGRWLDACAGAGGKTLQLARMLGPIGQVDAYDIRPSALQELSQRAARADLHNISILKHPATALYDGVLVDAPCTGSGTWRRSPHLKWTTTPEAIEVYAEKQLALLHHHAANVAADGLLIYATCSLNRSENCDVVEAFLQRNPEFSALPPNHDFGYTLGEFGLSLMPARHNTDGFHVAALRRR